MTWRGLRWLVLAGVVLAACGGGSRPLPAPKFFAVDVFVDAGEAPLAAWQVDVTDAAGRARLVSVEGGGHPAFAEPPRHDPRALSAHRVVLAAFHLGAECPVGRTRVATLHFVTEVEGEPRLGATLVAASDPEGRAIDARVEIER